MTNLPVTLLTRYLVTPFPYQPVPLSLHNNNIDYDN